MAGEGRKTSPETSHIHRESSHPYCWVCTEDGKQTRFSLAPGTPRRYTSHSMDLDTCTEGGRAMGAHLGETLVATSRPGIRPLLLGCKSGGHFEHKTEKLLSWEIALTKWAWQVSHFEETC